MRKLIEFAITVPTDEGFIGRACDAEGCKQYFKIHKDDRVDEMYCPYCGDRFPESSFFTTEQSHHLRKAAEEKARQFAEEELQKMFKKTFGSPSARRAGWSYKPGRTRKRAVIPTYSERKVDTELCCLECNCRFQVYGIFGYCPACGEDNLMVYDTNWLIIKREIREAENPQRALRHAYGDLVSAFETFCRAKARRLQGDPPSFQSLFDARKYFQSELNIDMLSGMTANELLILRRVFQKRHVLIHANGEITERYVKKIPEDKALRGQMVELSIEELNEASQVMREALLHIVKAIEVRG